MNSELHLEHCEFYLKQNLRYFGRIKKTPNTGEINIRRKSEMPKKQRKAKEIFGEGYGGLVGGASVWRGDERQNIG